jgi:hypothetical protein
VPPRRTDDARLTAHQLRRSLPSGNPWHKKASREETARHCPVGVGRALSRRRARNANEDCSQVEQRRAGRALGAMTQRA